MKLNSLLKTLGFLGVVGATSAQANLVYSFGTGVEGFQNVTWDSGPLGWAGAPSIKQTHTAGGWQMQLTKEFDFNAGGGAADQQVEMQNLANFGDNAHLAFDLMVDGTSFPAGAQTWFNFNVVGNSDGSAGWTQRENLFTASGWHNADDPTLISMHIDQVFSFYGWQPGDTWFQLHTGANSDGAVPVNFYIDNVVAYAVPEPSALALAALGATLLISRRRK
jgi:PEP-CTERM motif